MVSSKAQTVTEYLKELPADRRAAIATVRKVVKANLPKGYVESIGYGMITWTVPLSRLPETYNGQPLCYAALASQKNYCSLYLMCVYGDPALRKWFEAGFKQAGKKLDMGKSCVRFKTAEDLPLELIGEAIAKLPMAQYLVMYRKIHPK